MKLLKPEGCLFPSGGGNEKEPTMIVEGQGIGFRTRVRLPSGPSQKAPRRRSFLHYRQTEDMIKSQRGIAAENSNEEQQLRMAMKSRS